MGVSFVGHPADGSRGKVRSHAVPDTGQSARCGAVSQGSAPADRVAASALTDGAAPLSTMVAVGLAARTAAPES